jgi:glycosyltransferase involved in cell wall biosynthesis
MKVLALARYGRLGASSRIRLYQFLPYLRAQGIEATVAPLCSDQYLRRLYGGARPETWRILGEYLQRLLMLPRVVRYDLLWIEKELFPGAPAILEAALARFRLPYVVDYDDATFHKYDQSPNALLRTLLPHKIDAVMRHATVVTAGNEYLAARARGAGAKRVELIPTVVDLDRYPRFTASGPGRPRLGWIGSPITEGYLARVSDVIAQLSAETGAVPVLIGASAGTLAGLGAEVCPWNEATEVADLASLDVGIMPLPDLPFERGKCGYKLIQYMACGKPVVASPVGVNRQLVEHGVTGYLAETPEEWLAALRRLTGDAELRARMGRAGRAKVEATYSLQAVAPRLLRILEQSAQRRSRSCAAS